MSAIDIDAIKKEALREKQLKDQEYVNQWRKSHPDRVKVYNQRTWERRKQEYANDDEKRAKYLAYHKERYAKRKATASKDLTEIKATVE